MEIGLLGATGPAGSSLALRLASLGHDILVGSRSKYRAMEVRDELAARYPDRALPLHGVENPEAASAEMVIIATPWHAVSETAQSVARQLEGKVVVCMSNALQKIGPEFQPLVPPRGSVAGGVQAAVRAAYVVAALHHVPAKELGDIDHPVECDVLVCSDHPHATEAASDVIGAIPGVRALDAGLLSNATAIEAFTAVLLQLNVRYKTRAGVRFSGIA
jgi:8-hydroxy-5-deazaflavin:NADPH oxidoreductase